MIHILNYEPNRIGGGWTAARNLYEGLKGVSYDEADVIIVTGATMAERNQVEKAKQDGKKTVLRVDNHLLASRNRNTGMSRLREFAQAADLLIYQSEWARDYLRPFTGKDGVVVLNGVDTSFFKPLKKNTDVVYARSSRIAEKGWEMARYWFSRNHAGRRLNIVGKFSPENLNNNFDFFAGEHFMFYGEQPRDEFAAILGMSKYFLYPYFMDACSNTLLEARASGCEIIDVYGMLDTGGAKEIMECEDISLERMIKEYREAMDEFLS